jgi:uncharacterized protein YbaP (TraB family)
VRLHSSSGAAVVALLVACGLQLACASPQPANSGRWHVMPLAWRAEGPNAGDGSLFLLGSVHLGRSERHDFGPVVDAAYENSDELVVEVDLSALSEQEVVAESVPFLVLPDGRMLRDELAPETWTTLEAYFRSRGASVATVERLKPWAVSTVITVMEFQAAGLNEEFGVDRYFIDAAVEARRPIRGLETLRSQLEALDGLPPRVQELMLEDALARIGEDSSALVAAWENGDEESLMRRLFGPLEENPEFAPFYEAIFFRRNEAMTARLADLVGDGRRRFVVLGAAHMLDRRGIPALLRARGFRVERVSER